MMISVLITCYNLEQYIHLAIESVISQTLANSDYEIIVVDDSSHDNSAKIIKKYPVRYIRTPRNSGVLEATLIGLENCSGDIISFLDGDDTWHPEKLSYVKNYFESDPKLTFLTHSYKYVDSKGHPVKGLEWSQKQYLKLNPQEINSFIRNGILSRDNYVWLGSAYSIKNNKEILGEFKVWARSLPNPSLTYQDWPLAYWLASFDCGDFGYVPQKLLNYRVHGDNYSGGKINPERITRNFIKAYFTSLAIVDIASRSDMSSFYRYTCHEYLNLHSKLLYSLYNPSQITCYLIVSILLLDINLSVKLKEASRMILLRVFGLAKTCSLLSSL